MDDGGADAAAAAVDEEGFGGLKGGFAYETEVGGDTDEGTGGGLFVGDGRGDGVGPGFVDGDLFGESTLASEQTLVAAPDAVADAELFDLDAGGFDDTGEVAADDEGLGQFHGDQAGADVGIDRVQGDGVDADADLGGANGGGGKVAELDRLGGAGAFEVGGFHGVQDGPRDDGRQ